MESLNDALKYRMQRAGMDSVITAASIIESARRVLPSEFEPKTFCNGTLTIHCHNAAEAYFFKQEIDMYLERVNAALVTPVVTKLRLRVVSH